MKENDWFWIIWREKNGSQFKLNRRNQFFSSSFLFSTNRLMVFHECPLLKETFPYLCDGGRGERKTEELFTHLLSIPFFYYFESYIKWFEEHIIFFSSWKRNSFLRLFFRTVPYPICATPHHVIVNFSPFFCLLSSCIVISVPLVYDVYGFVSSFHEWKCDLNYS